LKCTGPHACFNDAANEFDLLARKGIGAMNCSPVDVEFLESTCHKFALITSLPFVHTAHHN
uniref:NeuB domain-containing protein n=1 Tax=Schistocephalus solidus TaxID=70667 RepID=A0A183TNZ9_SCHSO